MLVENNIDITIKYFGDNMAASWRRACSAEPERSPQAARTLKLKYRLEETMSRIPRIGRIHHRLSDIPNPNPTKSLNNIKNQSLRRIKIRGMGIRMVLRGRVNLLLILME